jgi:hypothetical protein
MELVATERMGPVYIPVDQIDGEVLEQLLAQLPEEALEVLDDVETIYVDGMAHINAKVWEKKGAWQINLHFHWNGVIALCDGEENVIVGFDARVLQVLLHLEIRSLDVEGIDALANVHVNGAILLGDGEEAICLDLKFHLLLRFEEGEMTMLKVWLSNLDMLELE